MDDLQEFFRKDRFAALSGIQVEEISPGRATVRMEIRDEHRNSHGTVHGGALFTLADTAFALASNSHGVPAAAIDAHISYITAARTGTLYAKAEEFALNPRLGTYMVTVTDDQGQRIALFEGMVYRKSSRT